MGDRSGLQQRWYQLTGVLRRNTDPVKFSVAFIFEQARNKVSTVMAGPLKGRLHSKGIAKLCHLQKRVTVFFCQCECQMGDAGRSHNRKPRPPMDFIIEDVAKFMIQHRLTVLWGREHWVNAAQ